MRKKIVGVLLLAALLLSAGSVLANPCANSIGDASGLVRDASGLVRDDASGMIREASGLVR